MFAAVRVELMKIAARKKYFVLLAIQLVIAAVTVVASSFGGFSYYGASVNLPIVSYMTLNAVVDFAVPLVCFMMCADLFAGEIENGTVRAVLLRPVSRAGVFVSKVLAILTALFINLMATYVCVALVKIVIGGGAAGAGGLFAAYALSIVPVAAFAAFGACVSVLFKHSSLTMFLLLVIYLAAQGLTAVKPQIGAVLFTSHLEWYKMFLSGGVKLAHLNTLLLIAAYCGIFGTAGAALLERHAA